MKVSLLWLKEFVDFDLTPEALAKLLRSLGFDTASITTVGAGVSGVVTAKVESRIKHPNADKLSLCEVFDGTTRFRVVCGAPNVAAGQTVPLARVGAKLPGGIEIKPAKIRGEESQGMLCSTRELALSEDHSGIFVLPDGTPLGEDINTTLMLNDAVLDVEVMPNRPDMLSHWGVAREIAAALSKPMKMPEMSVPSFPAADLARIDEKSLCSRYIGRAFSGVAVCPSPLWMRLRLERCGIRAINNLVDVTNYVLLELGHPLHVFDRDSLSGGRVTVRMGLAEEKLVCLDGGERTVSGRLVIADEAHPQAVAGIMGGTASGVTESTKNVLLESAHFNASHVREGRRLLNLSSESSYRFERGTDRDMAEAASRRASVLILASAGGTPSGACDVSGDVSPRVVPRVTPSRVEALLGFAVSPAEVRSSMERLGFVVHEDGNQFVLTPPPHRSDVRETADVAEEVGRLSGFDRVPIRIRAASQELEPPTEERRFVETSRALLSGWGFWEVKNYGLLSRQGVSAFNAGSVQGAVEIGNPLSLSGEFLASSLLPGLLSNLQLNRRRSIADARFFESARVFKNSKGAVQESTHLSFVTMGRTHADHWTVKPRATEVWDIKGWVAALLSRRGTTTFSTKDLPSFLHPAQSSRIFVGDQDAGFFGRLHPSTADALDLPIDTFVAQLDATVISLNPSAPPKFSGIPQHPALIRDFSLVFPSDAAWGDVSSYVMKEAPHAESVELFDVFQGKGLPEGHRSLAFRVAFRRSDRAMTDDEAAKIQEKLLAGLKDRFKAVLRQ